MAPTDTSKTVTGEVIEGTSNVLSRMGEMQIEIRRMVEAIPDTANDEGEANIIAAIMSATELDQLDSAWEARGLEAYLDRKITVTALRKGESDFADGIGIYLLIDALDEQGRKVVLTTGSTSCVVQLVKANTLGVLPCTFIPRQAKKPSAAGYLPLHLEVAR